MRIKDGVLYKVSDSDIVNGTFTNFEGIKRIAMNAFNGCQTLKEIVIPEGVETIGKNAFYNCHNLKKVVISDSVTSIDELAFSLCYELEQIKLPSHLKELKGYTFYNCKSLNNITVPNSVTTIGVKCFESCLSLSNIHLSSSLQIIDKFAFEGCKKLQNIKLPESLKVVSKGAFSNCDNLRYLEIPNEIEKYTFHKTNAIERIKIPEGVTKIDSYAFSGCPDLKEVIIPSTVTKIEPLAFAFSKKLETVVIPNNVKIIEKETFESCKGLKNVHLGNDVEVIEDAAFQGCISLEQIKFPEKLEKIGELAFFCSGIKKVVLPTRVKQLEKEAFSYCSNLEKIVLNEGLEEIGIDCFKYCSSLKSLTIPSTLKNIGYFSFNCCDSLEEIIKGDKVYKLNELKKCFTQDNDTNTGIIKLITRLKDDSYLSNAMQFPLSFLDELNDDELHEILKKDSIKHFKDIYVNYIENKSYRSDEIRDFYKLAYVLGCFSNEGVLINGKKVNVAQKASVFLKQALDNKTIDISESHDYFDSLEIKKYNIDLLKFITNQEKQDNKVDYFNFIFLLQKGKLMSIVINNFDKVTKQVITDNKGRIILKAPLRKKIDQYLLNTTYTNVNPKNIDIVEEFVKFTIPQKHFDEAQELRELSKDVSSHIVGQPLKEEGIIETIKQLQNDITTKTIETKQLLDELYEKEFTYEWLNKHDPKNFTLGLYCDCCASIISEFYGKEIMKDSMLREDVQNMIIKNNAGEIIAKATIYVNKEEGYAVFNDIEMNRSYGDEIDEKDETNNEQRVKIYKAFKRGVKAFVEKYNEINKDKPITQVNIGWGFNRLKQIIKRFEEKSEIKLKATNNFRDSEDEQWVIYKK